MPQALIPIIFAVSAATSAGLGIYGAVNRPSAPAGPTPAQISQDAIKQETDRRSTAATEASQFLPGIQANTSGGVSPEYYSQVSSLLSGNANLSNSSAFKSLINRFLGIDEGGFGGSGGFGGVSPSSPGLVPANA